MLTVTIWLAWAGALWESACIATIAGVLVEMQHNNPARAHSTMWRMFMLWTVIAVAATVGVNQ